MGNDRMEKWGKRKKRKERPTEGNERGDGKEGITEENDN
jgi:hypothetical protein